MDTEKKAIVNKWISKELGYLEDHHYGWVNIPRYILNLFEAGKMNNADFRIYVYVRIRCNEYGVAYVNVTDLNRILFDNEFTIDYVNLMFRKLKDLRLIWFENRTGMSGNFEVRLGDFFLPDGKISDLSSYFESNTFVGKHLSKSRVRKQVNTPKLTLIRKLLSDIDADTTANSNHKKNAEFVSDNTNTDTNTDTSNIEYSIAEANKEEDELKLDTSKLIPTSTYKPTSYEEQVLKDIALDVLEPYMNFLLSRYQKVGRNFIKIQNAHEKFKELRNHIQGLGTKIKNPAAMFNSELEKEFKK